MASFTPDSKLVSYTNMAKASWGKRKIDLSDLNFMPHHMATVGLSAKKLCDNFATTRTNASASYTIGNDGIICQCLPENIAPGTSNSRNADLKAITYEIENSTGAPDWKISPKALESTIALTVDICERHNIPSLNYQPYTTADIWGNTKNSITNANIHNAFLNVQYNRKNYIQCHQYFSRTACPGPYFLSIENIFKDEVNRRLAQKKPQNKYVYGGMDYTMVFDPVFYKNFYQLPSNDDMELFNHFLQVGIPNLFVGCANFNIHFYAYYNPDLQKVYGPLCAQTAPQYYCHYITLGYKEPRRTC